MKQKEEACRIRGGGALLAVAVPEGAAAGTVIQVQAPGPSGAVVQFAVPQGVHPGEVIQISV